MLEELPRLDLEFTKSLEETLGEWSSENDEEAYRDLWDAEHRNSSLPEKSVKSALSVKRLAT